MPESLSERSQQNRINAHLSWANTTDWSARTAPARKALDAKFLREADGDPKRAEAFRKAFYANLALKSAQSRKRRRTAREEARRQAIAELIAGGAA